MSGRVRTGEEAVLLMGYGAPGGVEELPAYLADVLGGRPPSPEMIREYERRYALIGWSPQMRILRSLREKLERRFRASDDPVPVLLATKHGRPHLSEVIPEAAREGFRRLVAVPLSPYASPWILAPYRRGIELGRTAAGRDITVDLRAGWHREREWVRYWSDTIRPDSSPGEAGRVLLLSAHSLPERLRRVGDPYPEILAETVAAIVKEARPRLWEFTYQSAGNTTEPWLGPDIAERIGEWKRRGSAGVTVAPFGFVFDHLEVLYDLDVVVRVFAEREGVGYRRLPLPNDDDRLVEALYRVALPGDGGPAPRAAAAARTP